MKNFLKLFLIVVSFFVTLSSSASCISVDTAINYNSQAIIDEITLPDFELVVNPEHNENAVVAANNRGQEIYTCSDRRNSTIGGNFDRVLNKNKLIQSIFSDRYNRQLCSTSHKISSYLKNEICTRAP